MPTFQDEQDQQMTLHAKAEPMFQLALPSRRSSIVQDLHVYTGVKAGKPDDCRGCMRLTCFKA